MTRQEAFAYIKANKLHNEVKQQYGLIYTSVSTEKLVQFCTAHQNSQQSGTVSKTEQPASGCKTSSRYELYEIIKKSGKSDEIKMQYGKHFTNLPTSLLLEIVSAIEGEEIHKPEPVQESSSSSEQDTDTQREYVNNVESTQCDNSSKLDRLIQLLFKKRIILPSEKALIESN